MIEKIVIKTGEVELSLTLEEARGLYEELKELFGKEIVPNYVPVYPWDVPTRPYTPWYMEGTDNTMYFKTNTGGTS